MNAIRLLTLSLAALFALAACGGGSGGGSTVIATPQTYTVGGSVHGLTASGLMLLNDGGDATRISAKATTFTMQTAVSAGSAYNISVGTDPYGITLNCAVNNGSGTARSNVTSVVIDCSTVTPNQAGIAYFLLQPSGVAVDAADNVYVTDYSNNEVKEIVAATGALQVLASGFNAPQGIAVDAAGNVYVADSGNGALKEIVAATGEVKTLASGFSDGPWAVAVDTAGNVYVTDSGNNAVKEIVAATGAINTLGSGFTLPYGVAVDAAGNVYVADFGRHALERQRGEGDRGRYRGGQDAWLGFSRPRQRRGGCGRQCLRRRHRQQRREGDRGGDRGGQDAWLGLR
jgi:hypothetical protein